VRHGRKGVVVTSVVFSLNMVPTPQTEIVTQVRRTRE